MVVAVISEFKCNVNSYTLLVETRRWCNSKVMTCTITTNIYSHWLTLTKLFATFLRFQSLQFEVSLLLTLYSILRTHTGEVIRSPVKCLSSYRDVETFFILTLKWNSLKLKTFFATHLLQHGIVKRKQRTKKIILRIFV